MAAWITQLTEIVPRLKGLWTGESREWIPAQSKIEPPPAKEPDPDRKAQNQNIIPDGASTIDAEERKVHIVTRVVNGGDLGGALAWGHKAVKWGTDLTGAIMDTQVPNPNYHWGVVVGDYLHQLDGTELLGGLVFYNNAKMDKNGWSWYEIGSTRYNDVAMKNAATEVIKNMPEDYDILKNNCQHFVLKLLDRTLWTGRTKQMLLDRTYGLQKQSKITAKLDVRVTRVDEFDSAQENDDLNRDLVEVSDSGHPSVITQSDSMELRSEQDVEEAKQHIEMLLSAFEVMTKNTPVVNLTAECHD